MNQRAVKTIDVRRLCTMAVLCAMAWGAVAVLRIPIIPAAGFLKLDVKDVIVTIGALLYGPVPGFMMAVVVALLEMITVSESGIIGFLMNVLGSGAFICTASFIYGRMRTMRGAVVGLVCGVAAMTVVMLLWNYIITPMYTGLERDAVAKMLVPIILPFNLLKGSINAALVLLLYKPVVSVMRKRNLVPESTGAKDSRASILAVAGLAVFVLVTCVLVILALAGAAG